MVPSLPIRHGRPHKKLIRSSNHKSGAMVPSALLGLVLLAAFVVTVVQIQLIFYRNYSNIACQDRSGTAMLSSSLVVIPNATLAQTRDMMSLKQEWKVPVAGRATQEQALGLNLPNSKHLPEINENGIIIFFLHIPKTGGTSMSHPFEHNPHWRYRMVYGWNKQSKFRDEMYSTLRDWKPGMRIFYEYHAGRASPYMDLQVREDILTWRAMARVRNIPFFAFTIVREPLSMAVSFFNFYFTHHKNGFDKRYFFVPDPTEKDFVELSLPSPQCLFCVHSEVAYYKGYIERGNTVDVGEEGCTAVYDAFISDFDWVGTTENMSSQTFPLVGQVANVHFKNEFVKNKSPDRIVKKNLSDGALAHIRNITRNDKMIYNNARRDFPITMWKNFDPTLKLPQPEKFLPLQMKNYEEQHITEIADPRYKRKGFKEKMQRLKAEGKFSHGGDAAILSNPDNEGKDDDQAQNQQQREQEQQEENDSRQKSDYKENNLDGQDFIIHAKELLEED